MFTVTIDIANDGDGQFFRAKSDDFDAALAKWGYKPEDPFVFYSREKTKIVQDAISAMYTLVGQLIRERGLPLSEAPDEIRQMVMVHWTPSAFSAPDDLRS